MNIAFAFETRLSGGRGRSSEIDDDILSFIEEVHAKARCGKLAQKLVFGLKRNAMPDSDTKDEGVP